MQPPGFISRISEALLKPVKLFLFLYNTILNIYDFEVIFSVVPESSIQENLSHFYSKFLVKDLQQLVHLLRGRVSKPNISLKIFSWFLATILPMWVWLRVFRYSSKISLRSVKDTDFHEIYISLTLWELNQSNVSRAFLTVTLVLCHIVYGILVKIAQNV